MAQNRSRTPVSTWKEWDIIDGKRVRALVIIFRTSGCWWARKEGCLMCGYNAESDPCVGLAEIREQLNCVKEAYSNEEFVKIYTSGSFLDTREIPREARNEIFETFHGAKRILIETRPEFVTEDNLCDLPRDKLELAMGLESASDKTLAKCVRKGFFVEEYEKAANFLNHEGIPLRTYLLLKPPFLTEKDAIEDCLRSISFASRFSESISINPVNVQKGTVVEFLWKRGDYRPPWLWSLVEVLLKAKVEKEARVFSSPTGGGSMRGAHNCFRCDSEVLRALERYTFSQDKREFDSLSCSCVDRWKTFLEVQDFMGTSVDIDRYMNADWELE
ncbi:MAG: archaeosine biosynthesis radical SAM protein RaSEA [Methanomassiliicoccales archaeon]|nr:archaeosine biosynthesis radical SAM protein RaSEA [Methanomassiliicoccales archaeon]